MTELEKLMEWLAGYCVHFGKEQYNEDGILRFRLFGEDWQAWGVECGIALGKMGVFLTVRNSWKTIAQYLIKYSMSSECQLSRIADALEKIDFKGTVNITGIDESLSRGEWTWH